MTAQRLVKRGKVVPVPGGVLVRDRKGAVVGAVGVTGDTSENDAEAALAGIDAAGLIEASLFISRALGRLPASKLGMIAALAENDPQDQHEKQGGAG